MVKWKKTNFPGVRYREHASRKNGIRKDQYFTIRYKLGGKDREEGLGWSSENWTAAKAYDRLRELKENQKSGEGPQSLSEKRDLEAKRKDAEKTETALYERRNITFRDFFEKSYFPIAKTSKNPSSFSHEETHFRLWLNPVIGKLPLAKISQFDIERVKKRLLSEKKAPRTIQYVMATFRQVWNLARSSGIVQCDSPTKSVKIGKFDNRRQRFLTHAEADTLLAEIRARDESLYRISLLSLHTGMRMSEILNLTWGCINTDKSIITILDAKSGKGRAAFMTGDIRMMFEGMTTGGSADRVFLQKNGSPYKEVPMLFREIVRNLGFNDGVNDPRQKVCFHTLRHSMASWHASAGTDLYVIKELLGHGTITLTERYAHLAPAALQIATQTLEHSIKMAKEAGQVVSIEKAENE
jgi:integrase